MDPSSVTESDSDTPQPEQAPSASLAAARKRPAGPVLTFPEEFEAPRWRPSLGRGFLVGALVILLILGVAWGAGAVSLARLSQARSLVVNELSIATQAVSDLDRALLNQETGVRGYQLSGRVEFLGPYYRGLQDEAIAVERLRRISAEPLREVRESVNEITAYADTWRNEYARPVILWMGNPQGPEPPATQGQLLFNEVRQALDQQRMSLNQARLESERQLNSASSAIQWVFGWIALGLLVVVITAVFLVRHAVIRPLARLAEEARQVRAGDFQRRGTAGGPRETVELARDVDAMRRRILSELSALQKAHEKLDEQARDLRRSNTELEQFAYVASHDLQEPLRKVASFCQLLQRRYQGKLDERADQYIQFAVDGAKRMQVLINDLLMFSRVGRLGQKHQLVNCEELVEQARANLALVEQETSARITHGPLPQVWGDASLLTMVFQNLISNALKFHSDQPPEVRIEARREDDMWLFSCTDNGIGIDSKYADRIFVIFQRLHTRDAYPGTGIGLALCKKVIEYHGGRMWLDTDYTGGARFLFTLPVAEGADTAHD